MPKLHIVNSIFSLIFLFACTSEKTRPTSSGEVTKQDVVQRISINGSVRGQRQAQVQPGYNGYVGKIFVTVGQSVQAGQPLVSILQTISQPLSEVFPIRAPFSGVVTQILKREGEYVTTNSDSGTLIYVDDLSQIWVNANVPEVDIAKVRIGLDAQIRANALPNKLYQGVVRTISLSPRESMDRWDRGRVEYPIEIEVSKADKDLLSGMTVVADVISAKVEGVPSVRHEFLHRDKDGYYLKDLKGQRHNIEIGLSNEEMVEITKGAEVGLKVEMKDFAEKGRGPSRRL